jgi:Ni,Fe-hydrogenase III large subunit
MTDWRKTARKSQIMATAERIFAVHGAEARAFAERSLEASIEAREPQEVALWRAIAAALDDVLATRKC